MSSEHYLKTIEESRDFLERACLAAFFPNRLKARVYDEKLGRSIEKRWRDQVIAVHRLIYERGDFRIAADNVNPVSDDPPVPPTPQPDSDSVVIGANSEVAQAVGEKTVGPSNADVSRSAAAGEGDSHIDGDDSPSAGDAGKSKGSEIEAEMEKVEESRDFLVFLDPHLEVDWTSDFEPPPDSAKLIASAEACAAVDCDFLANQSLIGYRLQIGQVIVCALQGQICEGQRLLVEATEYLNKRVVERSRQWTLYALLIFGLTAFFVTLYAVGGFADLPTPGPFLGGLEGGFLGAFISVAAKTGRAECDAAAGRILHFLEVLMRLAIGLIFGGVAVGLANSSLGPEPLKLLASSPQGILILAFASGLFQQSVPKMLSEYTPLKPPPES
ncbi:MAG: hypothetical protein V4689_12790 [Verrucomicrobiota bacterium]